MRSGTRTIRRVAAGVACVAALAAAGCGGGDEFANEPRPPATLVLNSAILPEKVAVSPMRFGAGPISLIVANETDASQQLSIVKRVNGQEQETPEQTGPINPHDTASLKAVLDQGEYLLRVEGDDIDPAVIRVGEERKSAQNELLLP